MHAQAAGLPVLGDDAYGGARRVILDDGTAVWGARTLHAARVEIPGDGREVECPWPADMRAVWESLGGTPPLIAYP